ncbi:hypothetical protein DV737_g3750, partial [Chaetothyriales sp. CBS 132003]
MAAAAAKTAVSISKVPTGIWETIRRVLAVDPDRSNGVPVKAFRNPPPGSVDPNAYDDPVTVPAADIADNPYWKRDVRRSYPRLSSVTQADAVALLTVGSAAAPSPQLAAGEEGTKQLVAAKEEGLKEGGGLAVFFENGQGGGVQAVLQESGGLPPKPVSTSRRKAVLTAQKYELLEEQSYENK